MQVCQKPPGKKPVFLPLCIKMPIYLRPGLVAQIFALICINLCKRQLTEAFVFSKIQNE